MILVGKDFVLQRKERATGVDEVDHAETVLLGDLLGPNMFLDGNGDERAALDGGVVGDEHPGHTVHDPDAGDDAAARHLVVVLAEAGQGGEFKERRLVIRDHVDPVADEHLAAREVAFDRALPSVAAVDSDLLAFAKGGDHGLVGRLVLGVRSRAGIDPRFDAPHGVRPQNCVVMTSASSSRFPRSVSNHSTEEFIAPNRVSRCSPGWSTRLRSLSRWVQRAS